MNVVNKISGEIMRLLKEHLILLITALSMAGVVWFSLHTAGRTASDAFIINAAKNSAFLGAFLFTLLTLVLFHRDYKNNTDVIVLTSTDPIYHQIRRTLSLVCAAIINVLLVSVFALPYAMARVGYYFQLNTFLVAWYLIYLGTLVFSVLLSSGLYMMTRRLEAASVIMTGLIIFSKLLENMFTMNPSYLLYWVQTTAVNFSDLITNQFQIDMLLWNRLFCLLVSVGVWSLGLCSFRRYNRGIIGSFIVNCRRVLIPVCLIAAVSLSVCGYVFEPLFDDSKPIDFSGMKASGIGITTFSGAAPETGNPNLTMTDKSFTLDIDGKHRSLSGTAKYILKNETGGLQTLPIKINTGLNIDKVLINGAEGKAVKGETGENSTANWIIRLPESGEYEIVLCYSGRVMNDNTMLQRADNGISDGYVNLPPIAVSPGLDINVSDNNTFSGTLFLDEKLEPVFLKGKPARGNTRDGKTEWKYVGGAGSKGTNIFAAEYMTKTFEAGGLNIELKYFKKHDKSITDMDAVGVIKATIDYFTKAYGPLIYDKSLLMLELPAYVSGGFAGGNMSAMDETSYDEEGYLPVDSLSPDQGGGIDVLVHEIAHQWWGLATMPKQDGVSFWSAEGLTCYSAYCFVKQYFGEDYADEHYVKGWRQNFNKYKNAFYVQHPEYLNMFSLRDVSNISASFLNMKIYDIMPLMLLKGEEELGGTEAFQKRLTELYMSHLGQVITYDDFLTSAGLTREAIEIA